MSVYCDTGIYTAYFQMRKIVSFKYIDNDDLDSKV
ncbi:hypothetical protein MCC10002_2296 [Bifidobacterium longum subsp. longum]|uniref:Uncharacterized protein n=2 Tax=Bifidobacterium longum TaxID=216816 RepID=A0A4R0U5F2_BIFLL|nr:hypothetical protein APC1503_0423 [Bifidobacterium longum]TCD72018.1 hypothetical protein MCC10002_2296 [Bifidobacterium longum subsp. longum]TCE15284.1 hypothetical protein MCC10027_0360 [Bifidobacterium longum subsp. longum]TCE16741.1 hypothetical protein MCC10028_0382 [Bifidobacterium longum subsp. longum]TCE21740.1 hypothetical protein MCC10033_2021 [Bifidobacterium longum subsp. longum]